MSSKNQNEMIRRDDLGRRTGHVKSREKKKFEQLFNGGMDYPAIGRATKRDPRTIKKYFELKAKERNSEYSATEKLVSSELSNYRLWLKQKSIRSETNHPDDLSQIAKILVKMLRFYYENWAKECTIEDILTDRDDFDAIEFFNDKITRALLVHLSQSKEFPELKVLHCWFNLEVGKITEAFLNLISSKAALRDFEGQCDLCRVKPGLNRKVAGKLK